MDLLSYPAFFRLLSLFSLISPSFFLPSLHRALGILMFKGILFAMFLMYPVPGKDLKWKRAPSLPMQELNRRFGRGSSKGGSGSQDRPRMPPRPPPPQPPGKSSRVTSSSSREKIPSHHEEVTTYLITSPNFSLLFLHFIEPFLTFSSYPPFLHTLFSLFPI